MGGGGGCDATGGILILLSRRFVVFLTVGSVCDLQQAFLFKDGGQQREVEGGELHAGAVVELVLKLHPETERAGQDTVGTSEPGGSGPTSGAGARAGRPISPP